MSTLGLTENLIEIVRGSSKTIELSVVDLDDKAVDITGARIILSVKRLLNDPVPLIQKSTDNPVQALITVPKGGKAEIYLKPADTHNLDPAIDYLYDLWVVQASGDRFVVVPLSTFRVQDSITRVPLT